jgi:hypothetical protein
MTIALPISYDKYAFKGEFFEDQLVIAVTRDRADVQALLNQADEILDRVFHIYLHEVQHARRERGETRPLNPFDSAVCSSRDSGVSVTDPPGNSSPEERTSEAVGEHSKEGPQVRPNYELAQRNLKRLLQAFDAGGRDSMKREFELLFPKDERGTA